MKGIGWRETLAYGKLTRFISNNINSFYDSVNGGILGGYRPVSPQVLQRKISRTIAHVKRTYYNQMHSTDSTGSQGETIPEYAQLILEFFEWEANQPARSASQQSARSQQRAVEDYLIRPRPPLGDDTTGPSRSPVNRENSNHVGNMTTASSSRQHAARNISTGNSDASSIDIGSNRRSNVSRQNPV
eukprot:6526322-Ditylum_brightwellii.AAC.1